MTDRFDPLETSGFISSGYRRYLRSRTRVPPRQPARALAQPPTPTPLPFRAPRRGPPPPYQPGVTLETLIREGVLNPAFRHLDSDALPLNRPLHTHQEQAIRKV